MYPSEVKVHRKYKDNLFRLLFGREEYRGNLLSLVNALYDTNYTDPSEMQITTMDDVIFINAKNDISLLLDMRMYLLEQQASLSPNMPVRGLIYFAHLYDQYIDAQPISIYGTRKILLPSPRYTVLYNGVPEAPAKEELRLSDAFSSPAEGFEWTATFININAGKNDSLLEKCPPLREYMQFVNEIRKRSGTGVPTEGAVREAVDYCIDHGILYDILKKHRAEVYDMCITEFDEEKYKRTIAEVSWEEGMAQGIEQGMAQGMAQGIEQGMAQGMAQGMEQGMAQGMVQGMAQGMNYAFFGLVHDGLLTTKEAAKRTNMTETAFVEAMKNQMPMA